MMKWGKTTLIILLSTFSCFSQEICNNAIDDDGDGMIDLNDTECLCSSAGSNAVTSYIPNASFEDHNYCPTQASQLNYSSGWAQCTNTTSDYYNTCGYIAQSITDAGLVPFPDGHGIAGAIFSNEWREYIGTELTTTLAAGKAYQITFNIASIPVNGDGDTCNNGMINYGALDITLYGSSNAGSMPVSTIASLTAASTEWIPIGSVTYHPVSTWGLLTITFIPPVNINAVMLGAPDQLPAAYHNNTCYPYFLFDRLMLSEAEFAVASITAAGNYCSGNLVLTAGTTLNLTANAAYQWYKNGIAVLGATSPALTIQSNNFAAGNYAVKIIDHSVCAYSTTYAVTPNMPDPVVALMQPDCSTSTATITLADTADLYSFDNGATWVSSHVSAPLPAGTYLIKSKGASGCESSAISVVISPNVVDAPQVSDIELCQFSEAAPLTASGTNLQWYTSATGGTGSTAAPVPSTRTAGIQTFYVSQTVNGCESDRVAVHVNILATPSMPVADDVFYCQYSQTEPLRAQGSNLLWYTTPYGGTGKPEAPVPSANVPGSTKYYVSQLRNGCESERKALTVVVFEAPEAPEAKTYISYNVNDRAEALTARGEDIQWYDADGNVLDGAPTPDTSVTGTTTYFVSQFVNGCESAKIKITVEVLSKDKNVVINYPKFFSPNGDGVHEQWNIYTKDNTIAGDVFIYDRNGQMVQQMKTGDHGWDGTFNGRVLPATDYWFRVVYTEAGEQKEFSSHFSLVR